MTISLRFAWDKLLLIFIIQVQCNAFRLPPKIDSEYNPNIIIDRAKVSIAPSRQSVVTEKVTRNVYYDVTGMSDNNFKSQTSVTESGDVVTAVPSDVTVSDSFVINLTEMSESEQGTTDQAIITRADSAILTSDEFTTMATNIQIKETGKEPDKLLLALRRLNTVENVTTEELTEKTNLLPKNEEGMITDEESTEVIHFTKFKDVEIEERASTKEVEGETEQYGYQRSTEVQFDPEELFTGKRMIGTESTLENDRNPLGIYLAGEADDQKTQSSDGFTVTEDIHVRTNRDVEIISTTGFVTDNTELTTADNENAAHGVTEGNESSPTEESFNSSNCIETVNIDEEIPTTAEIATIEVGEMMNDDKEKDDYDEDDRNGGDNDEDDEEDEKKSDNNGVDIPETSIKEQEEEEEEGNDDEEEEEEEEEEEDERNEDEKDNDENDKKIDYDEGNSDEGEEEEDNDDDSLDDNESGDGKSNSRGKSNKLIKIHNNKQFSKNSTLKNSEIEADDDDDEEEDNKDENEDENDDEQEDEINGENEEQSSNDEAEKDNVDFLDDEEKREDGNATSAENANNNESSTNSTEETDSNTTNQSLTNSTELSDENTTTKLNDMNIEGATESIVDSKNVAEKAIDSTGAVNALEKPAVWMGPVVKTQSVKTKANWTTTVLNGEPVYTDISVYKSHGPSYQFRIPGGLPENMPGGIIAWVRANNHKYPHTEISYQEFGSDVEQHTGPPNELPLRCGTKFLEKLSGGKATPIEENPWQVAVLRRETEAYICGGAVITRRHILSAAHCFKRRGHGYAPEDILLRVGDYDKEVREESQVDYAVVDLHLHEQYHDKRHLHDIALLTTSGDIPFSSHVYPICLPPPWAQYPPGLRCTVSGWGQVGTDEEPTRYLRSGQVSIISHDDCRQKTIFARGVPPEIFCAEDPTKQGVDTCLGDSGGPFACSENGTYYLYGITAFGSYPCGQDIPSFYTNVSSYKLWILHAVSESNTTTASNSTETIPPDSSTKPNR